MDDSDFDNYWNQGGTFEDAIDDVQEYEAYRCEEQYEDEPVEDY